MPPGRKQKSRRSNPLPSGKAAPPVPVKDQPAAAERPRDEDRVTLHPPRRNFPLLLLSAFLLAVWLMALVWLAATA